MLKYLIHQYELVALGEKYVGINKKIYKKRE